MPYEITLQKSAVFTWEELQPDIETTILKYLAAK